MFNWTFVSLSTQVPLFQQDLFGLLHNFTYFRKISVIFSHFSMQMQVYNALWIIKSNDDHHKQHPWILIIILTIVINSRSSR